MDPGSSSQIKTAEIDELDQIDLLLPKWPTDQLAYPYPHLDFRFTKHLAPIGDKALPAILPLLRPEESKSEDIGLGFSFPKSRQRVLPTLFASYSGASFGSNVESA